MKSVYFIIFVLLSYAGIGQTKALEKKEISRTDINNVKTDYIRVIFQADTLFKIIDYYKYTQKPAIIGFSNEVPDGVPYKRTGYYVEYYPNGNVKERAMFENDEYTGQRSVFFESGKPYKITTYNKDSTNKTEILTNEVWNEEGEQLVKGGFGKSKEFSELLDAIEEGVYRNGLRDSVWTGCYKNGSLCYKEEYIGGRLLEGKSTDKEGKTQSYSTIFQEPEFKGGRDAYIRFINEKLNYPFTAVKNEIEGKVYVKFVIEKDGTLKEAFPLKRVSPELDAEALRVVKLSNGKWKPGKNRGIEVRVTFTQPIVFVLE